MDERPIYNGIPNNLIMRNLDNVTVLLLVVLTIFSIWFNVGLLRIVCGLIFMLVLPGYVVINLFVDLFLFEKIVKSSRLIKLVVKIGEVLFGVVLSITIIPIIGLLIHLLGIDLKLVSITEVLALYIAFLSGADMIIRRRHLHDRDEGIRKGIKMEKEKMKAQ
ncbi:MAG: DUF1616 domain-containing protein [Euryarchaeota archaeon]|nr:DUF1616 domain-containing protein [Euryarchaeota archaeon]